MLYRSINVAIILLLSWSAYASIKTSQRLSQQLNNVGLSVTAKTNDLASAQLETTQKIADIQAYIVSQSELVKSKKKLESKLLNQRRLAVLHLTHSKVLNAELLRLNKQYADAAKLLKSTKKEIWKAGDTFKDNKKTLRGLVSKIDAIVNDWNKKNDKTTAKPIYLMLGKIIQEKGK